VELCQWLQIEELVTNGQLSEKAEGVKLDTLVPPSLQAMVQSQIDQLPTVPGVVLRCASVLGIQFDTDTLLKTVPRRVVQGKAGLAEQLRVLGVAHLIQRVVRFEYTGSNGGNCGETWKVNPESPALDWP
jgi:predicted ATPase